MLCIFPGIEDLSQKEEMSKEDLNTIQLKLRAAICNHQVLVGRLKKEPQNVEIQQQLRGVQAELSALNERQRQIVVQLRQSNNKQPASLPRPVIQQVQNQTLVTLPKPTPPSQQVKHTVISCQHSTGMRMVKAASTPTVCQLVSRQSVHKPSILQPGSQRGRALHLHSDVPVGPVKAPAQCRDLRGILCSAIHTKNLSPQEIQKIEFMASLNLITRDRLKEIQSKRSERKRRSTATPQFSYVHGHLPPERKRASNSVDDHSLDRKRGRCGRVTCHSPQTAVSLGREEECCAVCRRTGQLFSCHTCSLLYHHTCLSMATRPPVHWSCPKCQPASHNKVEMPSNAAVVESYLVKKQEKEREKEVLEQRRQELLQQQNNLSQRAEKLSKAIALQIEEKNELVEEKRKAEEKLKSLKDLVKALKS